jgi:nitrate reductase gamma subunit
MDDFVQGPMILIAFIVFVLGLLFQLIQFFRLTTKKEWGHPPLPAEETAPEKKAAGKSRISRLLARLRGPFWKADPILAVVTVVFHALLFATPVFLLGHAIVFDQSWGWSLFSLPEYLTDGLTVVVLVCGVYFLGRRIFLARVRAITTPYDYLVLLLVFAPFVTGFFAYHQWFHYETVMMIHILSGNILLMTIPFTKLGHMVFFFLFRYLLGGEYGFLRGSRTW